MDIHWHIIITQSPRFTLGFPELGIVRSMCVYLHTCAQSWPTPCNPKGLESARLLCLWDFCRQEYWSVCRLLLQGIFPTQGSYPTLPPPVSCVSCIGRRILFHWRVYSIRLDKTTNSHPPFGVGLQQGPSCPVSLTPTGQDPVWFRTKESVLLGSEDGEVQAWALEQAPSHQAAGMAASQALAGGAGLGLLRRRRTRRRTHAGARAGALPLRGLQTALGSHLESRCCVLLRCWHLHFTACRPLWEVKLHQHGGKEKVRLYYQSLFFISWGLLVGFAGDVTTCICH